MRHDPSDLGLVCLVKKRKIRFNFRIQSWIVFKRSLPENRQYQKYLWNVYCVAIKKPIGREKTKPRTVALK